jgi:hypothetical protein
MTPIECGKQPISRRTGESVPKKALITGNRSKDGSHLADLLLDKGSEVRCFIGSASTFNASRIEQLGEDPHEREARLCTESVRPLRRRKTGHPTQQHLCA